MASFGGLLGGAIGGAMVSMYLDDAKYNADLAAAEGRTATATGNMGRSTTKMGTTAKAGFALAGAAVVKFGADSFKAFEESEQVMAQFQNTLSMMPQLAGETTQAFQDQATALQNLTGYQDEEIISADNILARFKLTGDQIREAIPIVLDYARATGTDVPAAAQNIGKALLGNTRALKTVGIEFTATGDTGKDFGKILDLLQGKVGGAADAFGETMAGKIDIAKAKLDDFKEDVGAFIGSQLLLLTGDLDGAASMWVRVADATKQANDALYQIALTAGLGAPAIEDMTFAQQAGLAPLDDTIRGVGELTAAESAMRTEMQHATAALEAAAGAHRLVADAATDQRLAELSLAGGLLGLQSSAEQAADAESALLAARQKVYHLAAVGKKGTDAYRQAIEDEDKAAQDAAGSEMGLAAAVQQYIKDSGNSVQATQTAIGMIQSYGRANGLTAGETQRLTGSILGLVVQYGHIPPSVATQVSAPGASSTLSTIDAIKQRIDALHDKSVNIYVYTHYKQDI